MKKLFTIVVSLFVCLMHTAGLGYGYGLNAVTANTRGRYGRTRLMNPRRHRNNGKCGVIPENCKLMKKAFAIVFSILLSQHPSVIIGIFIREIRLFGNGCWSLETIHGNGAGAERLTLME